MINKKIKMILTIATLIIIAVIFIIFYPDNTKKDNPSVNDKVISDSNEYAIDWINTDLDKEKSIIASDYRLERSVESLGFKTTKGESTLIWSEVNLSEYIDELKGVNKNYSKITHVIIDDIMYEKGVHLGYQSNEFLTIIMTKESYNKFNQSVFEPIYKVETHDHWTEIYQVNWTYIDNN